MHSTQGKLWLMTALSAWPGLACAQGAGLGDAPAMQAAVVVMAFDHFAAQCAKGRGFSPREAAALQAWQSANSVDRVRALAFGTAQRQQLERAVADVTGRIAAQRPDACANAAAVAKTQQAQFGSRAPWLLAGPAAPAQARQPPAADPAQLSRTLARIESFGFDTCMHMGSGGFLAMSTCPVVLFRDGDVLTEVDALLAPGGLEAHKRARPQDWKRWRRSGSELQITRKDGWHALPFQKTYPSLPAGFRLDGSFQSLSGTGNVAVGGTSSVSVWRDYRFFRDGRVVREGGAGSSSRFGDASVVTHGSAAGRQGRYRIEGLLLSIDYDDGTTERRVLITDPTDPKSVIWLDGVGYTRRDR